MDTMTTQSAGGIPKWTIGDRLRKARETTGLTVQEFADEIGVNRKTAAAAESGSRAVREITVMAYSLRTGVPLAWLKTGEAPTPNPDGTTADTNRTTRRTDVWLTPQAVAA